MRVDASNELLQILNDSEADSFDGIRTGDDSWFHCLSEFSAMFAKLPSDVIPRTRKEVSVNEAMFTIFFTNMKLLMAGYLPKGQKYSQGCFSSDVLPEVPREKKI
jgi:hypothetical protein